MFGINIEQLKILTQYFTIAENNNLLEFLQDNLY